MTATTNPDAVYFYEKWPVLGIRYEPQHRELRFWLAVLRGQGLITGFHPDDPGVAP